MGCAFLFKELWKPKRIEPIKWVRGIKYPLNNSRYPHLDKPVKNFDVLVSSVENILLLVEN
jgi:hypothetical protein